MDEQLPTSTVSENSPPQKGSPVLPPHKKSFLKEFAVLLAGIIILFIITGASFFFFLPMHKSQPATHKTVTSLSPTTSPSPEESEHWVIKRNNNMIISYPDSSELNDLVKFNNKLIYVEKRKIYSYDLRNFHTEILADMSQTPQFSETAEPSINSLQLFGNTLYFSIGSWPMEAYEYSKDLTSMSPAQQITKLTGSRGTISLINNHYILSDFTYGDACGDSIAYNELSLTTKSITPIVNTDQGCLTGYRELGYDSQALYVAKDTDQGPTPVVPGPEEADEILTTIEKIPFNALTTKQILLTSPELPIEVTDAFYSEKLQQILLVSNALYQFDLQSKSLTKLMDFPSNWADVYFQNVADTSICIEYADKTDQQIKDATINLSTKNITPTSNCTFLEPKRLADEKPFEEKFKDLQLPAEYHLAKENY